MPFEQQLDEVFLDGVLAGQAELVAPLGHGVLHSRRSGSPSRISWHWASAIHPFVSSTRHGTSYFLGPIRLNTSSSRWSSRTKVAVSPSRRRAWMSAVIRNTGRRQKVNFVIDDQPPVALVEQAEVREVAIPLGPVGHDLVGRQRDRTDRLGITGVRGDLRLVDIGLVEDLAPPLLHRGGAGGQNEGLGLKGGQRGQAHDGLARAAGKNDDARASLHVAAGVEGIDGHPADNREPRTEGPTASGFRR